MKTTMLLAICVILRFPAIAQIQVQQQDDINRQKKEGTLPGNFSITNHQVAARMVPVVQPRIEVQSNNSCDCLLPIDSTFSVGQFDYQGGSGGPGVPPDYRNDDWSTAELILPFSFCYFGQTVNSVYINNNGNISIGATYSTFTSDSFPNITYTMLAPFWADVDTRGLLSGLVYYKITATYMIVRWNRVGYYGMHDDLLNDFQLIITDGTDSLVPGGNTAFCYGDMQWTTGDASAGLNGFGGTPSTVGCNQGNGTNFIQFGRFDQAGYGYDGPYNMNDSVDWLDSSNFIFDLCPSNVPPVPLDCLNDTIYMRVGDTADIYISFISPELNEITVITVNYGGLNNSTVISNDSADYATFHGRVIASSLNLGYNTIAVSATDNGIPVQTTSFDKILYIDTQTGLHDFSTPIVSIFPNPFHDYVTIQCENSEKKKSIRITDITGRLVLEMENIPSPVMIHKSELGNGIFIFEYLENKEIKFLEKLIVY